MANMTKKQALENFKAEIMPTIKELESEVGHVDSDMRVQEWNNYTDMLCKDGEITQKQYDTWTNPF